MSKGYSALAETRNRIAGLKAELQYAQIKAEEWGNIRYGGTRKSREMFNVWNNEVSRIQRELSQLEKK